MNRFWGHSLSAALCAVGAAIAVPACVAHNDGSIFVQGVLAPPIPNGNTCTYNPDPTSLFIPRGLVDGALTDTYSPEFLVGNQLIPQGNTTTPTPETARIEIQGTIIKVTDPTDNSVWENNSVLTSGILNPSSGSTPGFGAIGASIMDANAIAHFKPAAIGDPTKLAVVDVTFYGVTLGGQSIQSNVFQFPVEVCNGCLVCIPSLPTGDTPAQYCGRQIGAISGCGQACSIGQDQPSDCQVCTGNPACAG
jgi:hypothetical protein